MGLYDVVRTNYRLPTIIINEDLSLFFNAGNTKEFGYETEFQTKDFDCCLDHYLISSHGKLLLNNGGINEDINYNGIMNFNTIVKHPHKGGYFLQFHANFLNGKIAEIKGECIQKY